MPRKFLTCKEVSRLPAGGLRGLGQVSVNVHYVCAWYAWVPAHVWRKVSEQFCVYYMCALQGCTLKRCLCLLAYEHVPLRRRGPRHTSKLESSRLGGICLWVRLMLFWGKVQLVGGWWRKHWAQISLAWLRQRNASGSGSSHTPHTNPLMGSTALSLSACTQGAPGRCVQVREQEQMYLHPWVRGWLWDSDRNVWWRVFILQKNMLKIKYCNQKVH